MNNSTNYIRTTHVLVTGWILFWLLMLSVAVQDYLRNGGTRLWEPVLWEVSAALVVTLLIVVQRRLSREADSHLHSPRVWFAAQLRWLPAMCIGFVVLTYGIRHIVYAMAGLPYQHDGWLQILGYESIKITLFFGSFSAILFGILSYRALAQEKEQAERTAILLRQAQMHQLAQQIQPHFLFNALNTVSSLLHTDIKRADTMLAHLAEVLRSAMRLNEHPEVELRQELEFLRSYAQLMLERFPDRVTIEWDIDDSILACKVPAMSLQPLVENTFKHTVERRSKLVNIRISLARDGESLVVSIADDAGELNPVQGPGIGVRNLRDRLSRFARRPCRPGDMATSTSRRVIGDAAAMRVLIVDDERPARDKLVHFLKQHCLDCAVNEARDGVEALDKVGTWKPDVVFLDVQMPEVNGIEVAASLPDPAPLVVFVTAHDKYALQAFDANAVDYLLKPFDESRFLRTLERVRDRLRRKDPAVGLPADVAPVGRLLVSDNGATKVVPLNEILWLETADNYVLLHTANGTHILRQTLSGLLPRIGNRFVRCHRRAAVRLDAIAEVEQLEKGDCRLVMVGGEKVTCSRQFRPDVLTRLESG